MFKNTRIFIGNCQCLRGGLTNKLVLGLLKLVVLVRGGGPETPLEAVFDFTRLSKVSFCSFKEMFFFSGIKMIFYFL